MISLRMAVLAALGFVLMGSAAAAQRPASAVVSPQMPMRVEAPADPLVAQQERTRRFLALALDFASVEPDQVITVRMTDDDRQLLGDQHCENCPSTRRTQVGVEKVVGAPIAFDESDIASAGTAGRRAGAAWVRRLNDDRTIATIAVRAEDAPEQRLYLEDVNLPAGVELYLYSPDGEVYGPWTGKGLYRHGRMWTNTVSAEAYLELSAGPEVDAATFAAASFTISRVAVIDFDAAGATSAARRTYCSLESCFVDATCVPSEDFPILNDVKKALSSLLFQADGGGSFVCTGQLINSPNPGNFLLTANHCFATVTEAESLECAWDFQTASCGGSCPSRSSTTRTLGSTLLATSATTDFTFVQLTAPPPAGRVYLGWTTTPVANTNGSVMYRLSHPDGQSLAYSRHTVTTSSPTCVGYPRGNYIYSDDTTGATKGGSSGSAVVNASGQVLGQLFGACGPNPEDPCEAENRSVDGSFAVTYNTVAQWLTLDAPSNDDFADAALLNGNSGSIAGSNVGATREANEPEHFPDSTAGTVWYQWTAPAGDSGLAVFSTCNTNPFFDSVIAVYTGTMLTNLQLVTADADGCDFRSRVTFDTIPSQTYRIAVTGYEAAVGNFELDWTFTDEPANDNFADAITLVGESGSIMGSNFGTTLETGEPDHIGDQVAQSHATVWYNWTAPFDGIATFSTNNPGTDFDTVLAAYTGEAVNALSLVARNDDVELGVLASEITFTATMGTTYRVVVGGYDIDTGFFELSWSLDEAPNVPGDLNGDGFVTPIDAQIAFNCWLTGDCSPEVVEATAAICAPFDQLTPLDAQGVLNLALGAPVGCP